MVHQPLFGLLYDDDDDDECGAVGGMIGRGNRSTQRKSVCCEEMRASVASYC
jgi:hypothetical protein